MLWPLQDDDFVADAANVGIVSFFTPEKITSMTTSLLNSRRKHSRSRRSKLGLFRGKKKTKNEVVLNGMHHEVISLQMAEVWQPRVSGNVDGFSGVTLIYPICDYRGGIYGLGFCPTNLRRLRTFKKLTQNSSKKKILVHVKFFGPFL